MLRGAAEDGIRIEGSIPPSAGEGKRVLLMRRPKGPVAVVTPWNWPYTMPAEIVAPGARLRQHGRVEPGAQHGRLLGRAGRLRRRGGPPARRLQLRARPRPGGGRRDRLEPGHGRRRASSARPPPGRKIAERAAGKSLLLEMGGNGPLVVMDDADLDAAAEAAVTACFLCAGQSCTAGERLLVHEAVRDEFVERLREGAVKAALGDPLDAQTIMGPLNNEPVAQEDGRARRGCAEARRRGRGGRKPGGWIPHRPLLAGNRARRRARRRARLDRGDLRPDRPGGGDREPRRGHPAHERIALRPARRRSSPATSTTASASPTRCTAGS